jgi:hypothetical protein
MHLPISQVHERLANSSHKNLKVTPNQHANSDERRKKASPRKGASTSSWIALLYRTGLQLQVRGRMKHFGLSERRGQMAFVGDGVNYSGSN